MLGWSGPEFAAVAVAAAIPVIAMQHFHVDAASILSDAYKYLIVGLLWGITNPLLRQVTDKQETTTQNESASCKGDEHEGALTTLKNALTNWKFLLFFGMNQCGSALHAYLLGAADPALAVPLSNAFTFVFTALTSVLLGETPRLGGFTVAGILLVATGAGMCVVAKPQA